MTNTNPKIAMMNLYLVSRRIIKLCKHLDSSRIMKNLIMLNLKVGPKTIRELSDLFDTKHSWMSSTISKMEKQGVISKEKHKDPRCKLIKLTPAGIEAEKEMEKYMDYHCHKAFSDLNEKEVENLSNLVKKVKTDYQLPEGP